MNGLQKFYAGLWSLFGLIAITLFISGSMTMMAMTVLGFTTFGLIFMGMMCVLPSTVGHNAPHPVAPAIAEERRVSLRRFVNAWAHPIGVELGRPKVH